MFVLLRVRCKDDILMSGLETFAKLCPKMHLQFTNHHILSCSICTNSKNTMLCFYRSCDDFLWLCWLLGNASVTKPEEVFSTRILFHIEFDMLEMMPVHFPKLCKGKSVASLEVVTLFLHRDARCDEKEAQIISSCLTSTHLANHCRKWSC